MIAVVVIVVIVIYIGGEQNPCWFALRLIL